MTDGEHEAPRAGGIINDTLYDVVKFLALIAFPAFGALYFGLAGIWGLPAAEQVVGTVTVVDTFLGVLLGISKQRYDNSDAKYDGVMEVGPGKNSLILNDTVEKLEEKKELVFKVQTPE